MNCRMKVFTLIVTVTAIVPLVDCALVGKLPAITVVVAGQPFNLSCQTDMHNGQVTWRYLSLTAVSPSDIYTKKNVQGAFRNKNITVVPTSGRFDLVFNSGAALSDAGTYTCQEDETNNVDSTELTVLDVPSCNASSQGDTFVVTCQLKFRSRHGSQFIVVTNWTQCNLINQSRNAETMKSDNNYWVLIFTAVVESRESNCLLNLRDKDFTLQHKIDFNILLPETTSWNPSQTSSVNPAGDQTTTVGSVTTAPIKTAGDQTTTVGSVTTAPIKTGASQSEASCSSTGSWISYCLSVLLTMYILATAGGPTPTVY